jgi:hypothetical protein
MTMCANLPCSAAFTPHDPRQKFCCGACGAASRSRHYKNSTPQRKQANAAGLQRWKQEHPEAAKRAHDRGVVKRYKSGNLPPWMYT